MVREHIAAYLAGAPYEPNHDLAVTNKFNGTAVSRVPLADAAALDRAISAAADAAPAMRALKGYQRQAILERIGAQLELRREEFAQVICIETGKTIREARGEVARALDTFRLAAEEATRIGGQWLPLDISERNADYESVWKRVPLGPCSFITPFNFPLNLVAHKVAPAIAAGCPFVLKPAANTPLSALRLGEILAGAGLPQGAFSILVIPHELAAPLVEDERLKLLSFTGSPAVGWGMKSRAGRKRVALELGGNAACIVDRDADLDAAASRMTIGAFYQAGQSCISVQRVFAHRTIYDELKRRLVEQAHRLRLGDPSSEKTDVGPLISERDAVRIETWVREAVSGGARILCGGRRDGAFYRPTWLERVPPTAKLSCAEAFGPVATLAPFDEFEDALMAANDSDYGLQCGVFTKTLPNALRAWDVLEVGGVIINDVPAMRADNMPYGGVKASGFGREGVRFAIEEMTEMRLLVLKRG